MSKKWTPELDSILLHGVFEECQISFGKALCEKLAERVRSAGVDGFTECTPKSIENRLYSWKKKNTTTPAASGDTPVSTPKKAAARQKKEPATPKSKTPRAKKGAVKKKDEESEEATPSKGQKREAESEEIEGSKKVKLEQDDMEGVEGAGTDGAEEEV